MDKKQFVVFIAIGAIVITTVLQLFMSDKQLSPGMRRALWATCAVGVILLGCLIILFLLAR